MIRSQKFKIQAELDQMNISHLLYRPEITANYADIFYAASAAQPGIQQPKRRLPVTKQGYPDAAKKYTATCKAAERNVRASKSGVWEQDFLFLEKLTGGTS